MTRIITIRPSETESGDIQALMKHYKLGQASKAMIRASKDVPAMEATITKLKRSLRKLEAKHGALIQALTDKAKAKTKITKLIKQNTGEQQHDK